MNSNRFVNRFINRIIVVVAVLLIATASPLAAKDGVTVTISPEHLDAIAGKTATITITVDVPTTPPNDPGALDRASPTMARDPTFTVTVNPPESGTVSPSTFEVPRNRDQGTRAVDNNVVLTFTVSKDAAGGEVQIAVEGTQAPRLLGVTYEGLPVFRGLGRLTLRAQPGGKISGPAQRPPFSPTAGAVNPTGDMLQRGAGIAGVLGALALTSYVVGRKKKLAGDPVTKEDLPKPVKPDAKTGEDPKPPSAGCKAFVAAQQYQCKGDGSKDAWIHLVVAAIPAEGSKIVLGGPIKLSSDCNPAYDTFVEEDQTGWSELPTEAKRRYYKVRVPWEWKDRVVRFTVELQGKLTSNPPLTRSKTEAWSGKATHETAVTVLGANPKVFITADPPEIQATGLQPVNLKTELWLFYEEAPKEEIINISDVKGTINGEVWTQPGKPSWTPPFLIQDPAYVETVELSVECKWTGGPLYERSTPKNTAPIAREKCEISLRGCIAETKSETEFFVPLAGTPLFASAAIRDADGHLVNPLDKQCVSRERVKLRCEVRDLSQGPPGEKNGCKLPPKLLIDAGVPNSSQDAARTAVSKAPVVNTIESPALQVDGGYIYTAKVEGQQNGTLKVPGILFWQYKPASNLEPIHDGPVVYKIIVDDGFNGHVELQGYSRVALGSLVLETGGPDFRIYENQPFGFNIEYQPGDHGYRPQAGSDSKVELTWEFARVDENGEPMQTGGRGGRMFDMASGKFLVILGHTPANRVIYYNPKDGEVRMLRMGTKDPPLDWERFTADTEDPVKGWPKDTGLVSAKIRQAWHEMKAFIKPEPAMEWLPGTPMPPQDLGSPQQVPYPGPQWRDWTLALSVRFELRKDKQLIATSDRLAGGVGLAGRTPYDLVWRDHCFRYALLMLRLYMQDSRGKPYSGLYSLTIGGDEKGGAITEQGAIEALLPADAERAELTLYNKGESYNGPVRGKYSLKLGYLDPPSDAAGAEGRLNNLGLFASSEVTGKSDSKQFQRAMQRFQQLCQIETDGVLNSATAKKLEEVHDYGAKLPETPQTAGPKNP